ALRGHLDSRSCYDDLEEDFRAVGRGHHHNSRVVGIFPNIRSLVITKTEVAAHPGGTIK
ncbi:hypothetical protein L9F63_024191, partial [Diploptera punctata]